VRNNLLSRKLKPQEKKTERVAGERERKRCPDCGAEFHSTLGLILHLQQHGYSKKEAWEKARKRPQLK
jgi:uncharacterized C2H2 Zn-finger protein